MQPENEKERERKRVREGDGRHRRGMKTALVNGFLPDSFTRFSPFPSVSVVPLTHPPSFPPSFFSFSLTYFHFFPSFSSSLSPSFFLSSFPPLFFFPSSPTTVVFISAVRVPSPPPSCHPAFSRFTNPLLVSPPPSPPSSSLQRSCWLLTSQTSLPAKLLLLLLLLLHRRTPVVSRLFIISLHVSAQYTW